MRIGARFPNAGATPAETGLATAAERLEAAGFDSLWVSDHLAMPLGDSTPYPFSDDGRFPWPRDLGWSEAMTALAIAAGVTERIELGTAVLIAPLRTPLLVAMQAASISVEAGGRMALGVGAGWLADEFHAVGVPFGDRGRRLDAWIGAAREVWSGVLGVRGSDDPYPNPAPLVCRPVPVAPIPILVGGTSAAALRRVGRVGDGWVGITPVDRIDTAALGTAIGSIREEATRSSHEVAERRIVLQITASAGRARDVADHLSALAEIGVDDVIVDVDVEAPDDAARTYETLRSAV